MMSSFAAVLWQILSVLLIGVSSFPKASCLAFHRPFWTEKEEMAEREEKFFRNFCGYASKAGFSYTQRCFEAYSAFRHRRAPTARLQVP